MHAFDRQTERHTEKPSQYCALNYMQLHSKKSNWFCRSLLGSVPKRMGVNVPLIKETIQWSGGRTESELTNWFSIQNGDREGCLTSLSYIVCPLTSTWKKLWDCQQMNLCGKVWMPAEDGSIIFKRELMCLWPSATILQNEDDSKPLKTV